MKDIKSRDFKGVSNISLHEALRNALKKAGDPPRFSVVETFGIHTKEKEKEYHVVVKPKLTVRKKETSLV